MARKDFAMCILWLWPWRYDSPRVKVMTHRWVMDKKIGQCHDTPMCHGQQLCEILSRSNLAVRSYGLDKDFGKVCSGTLILDIWLYVKVITQPETTIVRDIVRLFYIRPCDIRAFNRGVTQPVKHEVKRIYKHCVEKHETYHYRARTIDPEISSLKLYHWAKWTSCYHKHCPLSSVWLSQPNFSGLHWALHWYPGTLPHFISFTTSWVIYVRRQCKKKHEKHFYVQGFNLYKIC